MVCSYIFVSEIMKMCKEKKVYENIEKVAFYHNGSCCFSYAGIWCTGCGKLHIDYYPKNRGEYSSKYVAFFTKLYYNHSCKKNLPFKNFFYINPLFNYLYSP